MALFKPSVVPESDTRNEHTVAAGTPVHDPAREALAEHADHADHHTHPISRVETHTVAAPGAWEVRPAVGSLVSRIALTLIGSGLMILSAFLAWFSAGFSINGTQVSWRVFDPMSESGELASGFLGSAGLVALILGGLALLGMALRSGWLTRIAGALGVIAFVLYSIRVYRASGSAFWQDLGIGAWLLLAGSVVAVIGGFMGTARRVVVDEDTTVVRDVPGHSGTWAAAS